MLVGINLLREGLDIPEITLVAILDADKEGFLRSETSLIQTIGRAARNSEGHVIMYADKITDSMRVAIDETKRRRKVQEEYNEAHGITPQTIQKSVRDLIAISKKVATDENALDKDPESMSKKELEKHIADIEKKMKKAALHNLGCKVNAYETEAMQELLEQNGYEIVPFQEGADIYIINTCTVTNMADRKSRQMIHRAKKMNPDAIVVAAGCYVQAQENSDKIDECIDIVIGNNKKQNLIEILEEYEQKRKEADGVFVQQEVIDINHTKEYEELHLTKTAEHTRAYIKVQDGCNQFCTYCIIHT